MRNYGPSVVLDLPDDPVDIPTAILVTLIAIGIDIAIYLFLGSAGINAPAWAYLILVSISILMSIGGYAMRREAFAYRKKRAESLLRLKSCLDCGHCADMTQLCEDIALSHRASRRQIGDLSYRSLREIEERMKTRLPRIWLFDVRLTYLAVSPLRQAGSWFKEGVPVPNRIESDVMNIHIGVILKCVPLLVVLIGTALMVGIVWNHEILAFLLLSLGSSGIALLAKRLIGAPWFLNYTHSVLSLRRRENNGQVIDEIYFDPASVFALLTVRNRLDTGTSDLRVCNWNIVSDRCERIAVTTGVMALETPWADSFERLISDPVGELATEFDTEP